MKAKQQHFAPNKTTINIQADVANDGINIIYVNGALVGCSTGNGGSLPSIGISTLAPEGYYLSVKKLTSPRLVKK